MQLKLTILRCFWIKSARKNQIVLHECREPTLQQKGWCAEQFVGPSNYETTATPPPSITSGRHDTLHRAAVDGNNNTPPFFIVSRPVVESEHSEHCRRVVLMVANLCIPQNNAAGLFCLVIITEILYLVIRDYNIPISFSHPKSNIVLFANKTNYKGIIMVYTLYSIVTTSSSCRHFTSINQFIPISPIYDLYY